MARLKRMSLRTTSDQRPNKKLDALLLSLDVLSNQLVASFAALAVALLVGSGYATTGEGLSV